jgi:hypothetical protein
MTERNQQCTTKDCQHITKQIGRATMHGTVKRRRARTRLKDEVEEDLSIIGI